MLWLYLHFPRLQLSGLFFEDGSYPVAIVDGNTLCQLNVAANKAGLKVGMGLAAAAAMCPTLTVYPYDASCEEQRLEQIAAWLYWVTSDISLRPPNGLILAVSPMLNLYSDLTHYWQVVQNQLEKLISDYDYALAYSPLAARLLALHQYNQISDNPKLIGNTLNRYALMHTELSDKTKESLARLGISQLKALLNLPLADIAKRFDIELVTYLGRLQGQLKTPLEFYRPPEVFSHKQILLYELTNLAQLDKPLLHVLQLLESFLLLRSKQTNELKLTLILRDSPAQDILLGSGQGEYKAKRWLELCQLALESVKLQAPVIEFVVDVTRLIDFVAEKADLFTEKSIQFSALLSPAQLVAQLQAKLGQSKVRGLQLTSDFRPECATTFGSPLTSSTLLNLQTLPKNRPSFLLEKPQPLTEQVEIIHGPERIKTGWWDNETVCRDYYIARSLSGRWLWLFKTPDKTWFIHGLYS